MVKSWAVCKRNRQPDSFLMLQSPSSSIETRASWVVASVALLIMAMSFGAAWITAVALKDIAAEVGGTRSIPALASALAWLGGGIGGFLMGRIADRVGSLVLLQTKRSGSKKHSEHTAYEDATPAAG
jgi:hypothetical protein